MSERLKDLVSIVIPTYNHAQYLNIALRSILNQTYSNWEAIVVDNFSTDDTDEIMCRFIDPRITHIKINNRGIIAISRNVGIEKAKGEWIAFLDSDDFWFDKKLSICLNYANANTDFIYHDMRVISERNSNFQFSTNLSRQVKTPILENLIAKGNPIVTSSVLVRSNLMKKIRGMNEDFFMVGAEDYNTWLRVSRLTNGFKYIPDKLGCYRLHHNGVSSRKDMSLPMKKAIEEFTPFLNDAQLKIFDLRINYIHGRYSFLLGNYQAAKISLVDAISWRNFRNSIKAIWMIFWIVLHGKK